MSPMPTGRQLTLLLSLQDDFASLAQNVAEHFYGFTATQENAAEIAQRLHPERFEWLKPRLAQHLTLLMSDELKRRTS